MEPGKPKSLAKLKGQVRQPQERTSEDEVSAALPRVGPEELSQNPFGVRLWR